MKQIFAPVAKKCFTTIRINANSLSNKYSYSIKHLWVRSDCTDKLKCRTGRYENIIIASLGESIFLLQDVSKTIKNEVKEQNG